MVLRMTASFPRANNGLRQRNKAEPTTASPSRRRGVRPGSSSQRMGQAARSGKKLWNTEDEGAQQKSRKGHSTRMHKSSRGYPATNLQPAGSFQAWVAFCCSPRQTSCEYLGGIGRNTKSTIGFMQPQLTVQKHGLIITNRMTYTSAKSGTPSTWRVARPNSRTRLLRISSILTLANCKQPTVPQRTSAAPGTCRNMAPDQALWNCWTLSKKATSMRQQPS